MGREKSKLKSEKIEVEARSAGWKTVPACKWFVVGDDNKLHCMHDVPQKYNPDIVCNIAENCILCTPENCPKFFIRWRNRLQAAH